MAEEDISRLKHVFRTVYRWYCLLSWHTTCFPNYSRDRAEINPKVMELRKEWKLNQLIILSEGKMAESKGALLAKSVQKHAGRAKEKVRFT